MDLDSEGEALDLIVQLHPSIPPIPRTRWTGPIAMRGRSPRGRARGLLDKVLEFLLEKNTMVSCVSWRPPFFIRICYFALIFEYIQ